MTQNTPAVRAHRVRLSSSGRTVYPATSFAASPGALVAVLGASGTGKTSLLLTVAGRMRGWNGDLEVCGIDASRESSRVRGLVGLGLMPGVNDFAEALSPAQHVTEQRVFVRRSKRSPYAEVLDRVGISAVGGVQVKHLDAEQRVRLGVALALVRDIRVLVVDDLDRDLNHEERYRVLGLLRHLADEGLTVVFACVDEATAAFADVVVPLENEPRVLATGSHVLREEVSDDAVA